MRPALFYFARYLFLFLALFENLIWDLAGKEKIFGYVALESEKMPVLLAYPVYRPCYLPRYVLSFCHLSCLIFYRQR